MATPIVTVDLKVEDTDPGYREFIARLTDPATHVDIGIHSISGPELVMIASVNEFGTDRAGKYHNIKIPARPFVRSTVDERRSTYEENAQRVWQRIVDGQLTIFQGLSLLGQLVESDIKQKIIALRVPGNAESTKKRKGSDNPLIDTGTMVNSVRYIVKDKNDRALSVSSLGSYQARTKAGKLKSPPPKQRYVKGVGGVKKLRGTKP